MLKEYLSDQIRETMYLEHFIVVPENQAAYDAAMDVLSGTAGDSILWLHGPSGVGKTHLLQGLSHALHEKFPDKTIYTCTAEAFCNQIVATILDYSYREFSEKISHVDYLLMDSFDYHEFNGIKTMGSFMQSHIDAICQHGGKIVLTATTLPPDEAPLSSFIGQTVPRLISMGHSPELLRHYGQRECLGLGVEPTPEMLELFSLMSSCREVRGYLLNEALLQQMHS